MVKYEHLEQHLINQTLTPCDTRLALLDWNDRNSR